MTAVFGLVTNWPIALAPGMGLNAFFAFTICGAMRIPWQAALAIVFLSGCCFLLLTLTGIRQKIVAAIPHELKVAISAGIGLFIAFIGLKNGGIVVADPATLVTAGPFGEPRVLLVFERQPGTLRDVYASGGIGFLHELLEIAGGDNVFADVARESVQPSQETLLERSPEVILEVRAEGLIEAPESSRERDVWAALPSIAAVRSGRVYFLSGPHLVVPGPRVGQAAEDLARVLHPPSPGDR